MGQGTGQWQLPFDHQHATTTATDALYPFTAGGPTWAPGPGPSFQAVHMAVIPVGQHRGKVIVWDTGQAVGDAAPFSPGVLWNFQRYAIVDPHPNAAIRFYNYFLPMGPVTFTPPTASAKDLFCSGHAWSPFGYLVVAAGTNHSTAAPPPHYLGADLVYSFDPRFDNAPFPGFTQPLYPLHPAGTRWRDELFTLRALRFYPTVTLTRRFNRPPVGSGGQTFVEAMLVSGGSHDPNLAPSVQQDEWYTFEALLVTDGPLPPGAQRVFRDTMAAFDQWWGPIDDQGPPTNPSGFDGFHEYPKMHLLSNGKVFHAGDIPPSAQVDHSFASGSTMPIGWTATSTWSLGWDNTTGTPGPSSMWRHACSSVHFVRIGSFTDLVVRIGGQTVSGPATNTCELCFAGTSGAWVGVPTVPNLSLAREHANAVLLPDGSIFVVGGQDAAAVMTPELFRWGTGQWTQQPNQSSPRGYHSTAALLDDGSVLVAGGNGRTSDYEIYLPPYMAGTPPPARPADPNLLNPSGFDLDGTPVLIRPSGLPVAGFNVECSNPDYALDMKLGMVVLMAPNSVTHSTDMHQRYIECSVTPITRTTIQFTAPSESQAPRGYYRLFVLSTAGIPSKALWVRLA